MTTQLLLILAAVAAAGLVIIRPDFLRRAVPDRETIGDLPRRAVFGSDRLLDDVVRQAERNTFRVGPRVYMPDDVLVEANPADFTIEPHDFSVFCAERLQARADELSYVYAARLKVLAVSDPTVRRGRPKVTAKVTTGTTVISSSDVEDSTAHMAADKPMAGFTLVSANDRWSDLELSVVGQTAVVGSSKQQTDVRLVHRAISGRHAELSLGHRGGLKVKDLDSTNGTFVDGRRLAPQTWTDLVPGSVLQLGPAGHGMPEWTITPAAQPTAAVVDQT